MDLDARAHGTIGLLMKVRDTYVPAVLGLDGDFFLIIFVIGCVGLDPRQRKETSTGRRE